MQSKIARSIEIRNPQSEFGALIYKSCAPGTCVPHLAASRQLFDCYKTKQNDINSIITIITYVRDQAGATIEQHNAGNLNHLSKCRSTSTAKGRRLVGAKARHRSERRGPHRRSRRRGCRGRRLSRAKNTTAAGNLGRRGKRASGGGRSAWGEGSGRRGGSWILFPQPVKQLDLFAAEGGGRGGRVG